MKCFKRTFVELAIFSNSFVSIANLGVIWLCVFIYIDKFIVCNSLLIFYWLKHLSVIPQSLWVWLIVLEKSS